MVARHVATGLNSTPKWVWIYFTDTRLAVARSSVVRVPWGMVADGWQGLSDGVNAECARRLEAQAQVEQLRLPLERWE